MSHHKTDSGFLGGSYFLGFIGAFVYMVQTATGFWDGVAGFFVALVWPAFLIFHLFSFLKI